MEYVQSPFLLTARVSSCPNGLKLRGWNTARLFQAAVVDPGLLQQSTFPADAFHRLLEMARDLYDAPDVGIESRRGITPGSLLSVSLTVMSRANLREGLSLMVKYNAGLTNCFDIFLAEEGSYTSFGLAQGRAVSRPYPQICDAVMECSPNGIAFRLGQWPTGDGILSDEARPVDNRETHCVSRQLPR